ncbi:MAG: polysaccharide biosynthesis/export family protein [Candidatus Omnitrophota bacterium]|nr:polysaccharide biosynthesis/export family protein [Candidatus Omnitrophota bacterium]
MKKWGNAVIIAPEMKDKNKFIVVSFILYLLAFLPAPIFSEEGQAQSGNKGYLAGGPKETEPSPIVDEEFWTRPLEYYIGTGDVIEISVWDISELSKEITVRPDGKISYPLIGEVDVYGLSMSQLDDELTKRFSVYIRHPQVTAILKKFEGKSVFVLGEVRSPGIYKYGGQMRLIEVISAAGGFTLNAAPRSVLVIRGDIVRNKNPQLIKIDAASIYSKARLGNNILLQPNDIIFVSRSFIANATDFFTKISTPLTTYLLTKTILNP